VTAPEDFTAAAEERVYRTRPERSFGALLNGLTADLQRLIRLEIALFKREVAVTTRRLSVGLTAVVVGAVLAFSGWLAAYAAAIIALALVWPAWLAAVVLGGAMLVLGGILILIGILRIRSQQLAPTRTFETLREDGAWIKERVL
jgi:predicted phage tail protein